MAFDLLHAAENDLRSSTLHVRRQLLESVLEGVVPPIQLAPHTADFALAQDWLEQYRQADLGIEGLVIKGAGSPYKNGAREWLKFRLRDTVEAVVGAVTGSLAGPEYLVLGLPDADGALQVAGTSTPLNAAQRAAVASLLEPPDTISSWTPDLRVGRWGSDDKEPAHPVKQTLVVEVSADIAFENGRWRHPTRFIRVRPDLTPAKTLRPGTSAGS